MANDGQRPGPDALLTGVDDVNITPSTLVNRERIRKSEEKAKKRRDKEGLPPNRKKGGYNSHRPRW